MKEELISVIVPIYNVEKYLVECIDSLLNQSYQNYELILVDDGSCDNCPAICDDYINNSHVIVIHKENGGLSDARNAGIDVARGKYLTFVDGDDYVSEHYLMTLYYFSKKYDADIVQAKYSYNVEDIMHDDHSHISNEIVVDGNVEALRQLLLIKNSHESACVKLYKSYIFDDLRFPLGRINEDTLTTYKFFLKSNRTVYLSSALYYYRYNDSGILHSPFSEKRFSVLSVFDEMREYVKNNYSSIYSELIEDISYYEVRKKLYLYNLVIALGKDKQYQKELDDIRRDILTRSKTVSSMPIKYKALLFVIKYNPILYRFLVKTIRKPERDKTHI